MGPSKAICIKKAIAPYYPSPLHRGIILEVAPFSTIYTAKQWKILWSDGTTGVYPVSIIEMGWIKI